MSLRRFLLKNRKSEVQRNSNDRPPAYTGTSNVKTTPTTLPGSDPERPPPESSGSLTETLGAAETSKVATPTYNFSVLSVRDSVPVTDTLSAAEVATPNYSKRPFGKPPPPTSHFCEFC
jgi:hypothetical protein